MRRTLSPCFILLGVLVHRRESRETIGRHTGTRSPKGRDLEPTEKTSVHAGSQIRGPDRASKVTEDGQKPDRVSSVRFLRVRAKGPEGTGPTNRGTLGVTLLFVLEFTGARGTVGSPSSQRSGTDKIRSCFQRDTSTGVGAKGRPWSTLPPPPTSPGPDLAPLESTDSFGSGSGCGGTTLSTSRDPSPRNPRPSTWTPVLNARDPVIPTSYVPNLRPLRLSPSRTNRNVFHGVPGK